MGTMTIDGRKVEFTDEKNVLVPTENSIDSIEFSEAILSSS